MSNYWELYCRDCDSEHTFTNSNHCDKEIAALIKHADAIATMAGTGIELKCDLGQLDADWFLRHLGHNLIPRDEYGSLMGSCGKYFDCKDCKHPHQSRCVLPYKHEEACSS